jgi:hypothetical protein
MNDLQQFYTDHTAIAIALLIYIVLAGLIFLPLIRRPMISWWNSQFILYGGSSLVELFLKRFAYRIGFELFVFVVACAIGALGGWIYVVLKIGNVSSDPAKSVHGSAVSRDDTALQQKNLTSADRKNVVAARSAFSRGDYSTAFRLYRPLADQGNAEAQAYLGFVYGNGHGVAQDYAEAAKWFCLAADQGNADAQGNLGNMFDNGHGVPRDCVKAHMWYNLSAARGNQDSGKCRDRVAENMTPAQIAEAQKLAREWKPNT